MLPTPEGWQIALDGKPVMTPRKQPLHITHETLAQAIAQEWRAQEGEIKPHYMPLTQMANGVADLTEDEAARLVAHMANYAASDMLYFRDVDAELRAAQEQEWEPRLQWAESRYDVKCVRQESVMMTAQSPEMLQRMRDVLQCLPLAHLVALNVLATGYGSLILALAVYEGELEAISAFKLSLLEQQQQQLRWGADDEQVTKNAELEAEIMAAEHFLRLLR